MCSSQSSTREEEGAIVEVGGGDKERQGGMTLYEMEKAEKKTTGPRRNDAYEGRIGGRKQEDGDKKERTDGRTEGRTDRKKMLIQTVHIRRTFERDRL